jgi:hypothetical protein
LWARLRQNKREKKNRDSQQECSLEEHSFWHPRWERWLSNFGCTLESPGSFKKVQVPRLHPRPIKSRFWGDRIQISGPFFF